MHELSIAINLVEYVSEEAAQAGWERVSAVHLKIGPLSGVVSDALLFSFEVAAAGTVLEAARLIIEDVPIIAFCPTCQTEQSLPDTFSLACPVCDTPTPDIRQGREMEVTALEVHSADVHQEDAES
ncbi:MAG TPA: hydrogenase maturation nickel metallochaperone HypA [Rhodothermales bacterium]|nr:hydrogenase maturation nickel metallochaperone HypA [Rhodothermales bacterium]